MAQVIKSLPSSAVVGARVDAGSLAVCDAPVTTSCLISKPGNNLSTHPQLFHLNFACSTGGSFKVWAGWFDFFEQTLSISKFVITTPFEEWFSPKKPRGYLDSGEEGFPEIREWAGVAEISNSVNARTLIDSIAIYKNGAEYAEFWGNGGKFKDTSQGLSGYNTAALEYVDGVGWRGTEQKDISSDLNTWYGSFVKDKKVVWSNLADRCNSWSKKRNRKVSASEDGLRLLCYKEPTKPS